MLMLILSIIINQSTADTLLVKGTRNISYRLYISNDNLCFQYQAGRNWSEPTKIDSGGISEYAVAIKPGDYLHIVWSNNRKLCYQTNYKPITSNSLKHNDRSIWSERIFISTYYTEPVSNISTTIKDEYIYVTWQVPVEGDSIIFEKWRRVRWIYDVPNAWEPTECISKSNSNNQTK
jgi:hypothetical protein